MSQIFTLDDISEFLLEQGYPSWAKQVYDFNLSHTRTANNEDFEYLNFSNHTTALMFRTKNNDKFFIDAHITNFYFLIYRDDTNIMNSGSSVYIDKNLSQLWQQFLLTKHQSEYASILFDWATNKMAEIQTEADNKIKEFTITENTKAKKKIEKYNTAATLAMQYLSADEIDKIAGIPETI